jgi:hypothetical protein
MPWTCVSILKESQYINAQNVHQVGRPFPEDGVRPAEEILPLAARKSEPRVNKGRATHYLVCVEKVK